MKDEEFSDVMIPRISSSPEQHSMNHRFSLRLAPTYLTYKNQASSIVQVQNPDTGITKSEEISTRKLHRVF